MLDGPARPIEEAAPRTVVKGKMQMNARNMSFHVASALMFYLAGCGGMPQQQDHHPSWEEFRAQAYQEPDTGIFIVDGDEPILNEARLRLLYDLTSNMPARGT